MKMIPKKKTGIPVEKAKPLVPKPAVVEKAVPVEMPVPARAVGHMVRETKEDGRLGLVMSYNVVKSRFKVALGRKADGSRIHVTTGEFLDGWEIVPKGGLD